MKKIYLLMILSILLFVGCNSEPKKLEVTKKDVADTNKYNVYYERDERIIYISSSLEEVYYNADTKMTLKDYISKSYQTMDDSIKSITDLLALDVTLKDGGTEIYRSEEYDTTLIKCNRLKVEGTNKDIFIGRIIYGLLMIGVVIFVFKTDIITTKKTKEVVNDKDTKKLKKS